MSTETKAPRVATFGSMSSGTMRPEDLIPVFGEALEWLANGTNPDHAALAEQASDYDRELITEETQDEDDLLHELFEALQEYAPAYAYFGASEGDGADYGYWLSPDFEHEFEGAKISDPAELDSLPDVDREALFVNDHGNMTLYARAVTDNGIGYWSTLWEVV